MNNINFNPKKSIGSQISNTFNNVKKQTKKPDASSIFNGVGSKIKDVGNKIAEKAQSKKPTTPGVGEQLKDAADKLSKNIPGIGKVIGSGAKAVKKAVEQKTKYTVKQGDNLWNIAKQQLKNQGIEKPTNKEIINYMRQVSDLNGLELSEDLQSVKTIHPGQELKLPLNTKSDKV